MSVTTTFMFCLTAGAVNPATENKSSSPSAQPNINSSPPAKTICLWSAADSMAFLEHPPLLVASARERSATSVRVLFQIIGSDVSFFPPWFTAVKNKFDSSCINRPIERWLLHWNLPNWKEQLRTSRISVWESTFRFQLLHKTPKFHVNSTALPLSARANPSTASLFHCCKWRPREGVAMP